MSFRPRLSLRVVLQYTVVVLALWLLGCQGNRHPARITFLVTGNTKGFFTSCGCAAGQQGGVQRRTRVLTQERDQASQEIPGDQGLPSEVILVDVGDFSDPTTKEMRLESTGIVRSLEIAEYDSVGLGVWEVSNLRTQAEILELLSLGDNPYTAANVTFKKPRKEEDHSTELTALVEPYRIVKADTGYKIGIIHVIDNSGILRGVQIADGVEVTDPVEAIHHILDEHKKEASMWVLTIGSVSRSGLDPKKVATITDLTLAIGFRGGNPLQTKEATQALFPFFIERPFDKGKDVVRATVTFADQNKVIVDAVKIGVKDTYTPDERVQAIIDELAPERERLSNERAEDALNQPVQNPIYMGWDSCKGCHQAIVDQQLLSKHMVAYSTLVEKKAQWRGECAQCHNVGFNEPRKGWNVVEDRQQSGQWTKRNVQCENCHGPAEFHVKLHANNFKSPELQTEGRNAEGLLPITQQTCIKCHDPENSPKFNFEEYWHKIRHSEREVPVGTPNPKEQFHGEAMDSHASAATLDRLVAYLDR